MSWTRTPTCGNVGTNHPVRKGDPLRPKRLASGLVKVTSNWKRVPMASCGQTRRFGPASLTLRSNAAQKGRRPTSSPGELELKDSSAKEPARPLVKTVVNEELVGVDFGLQRSDVEKAGDTTHSNSAHKGNKILHFWLSSRQVAVHLACQTWRGRAITLSLIRLENT